MNKISLFNQLVCLCFSCIFTNIQAQTIHYVKPTASGTANGSSWANASNDLQTMITTATAGDEIWVAAGTYLPTRDPLGNSTPTDSRDKTFYLKDGVKLYGGFVGNETALSQRNWITNLTKLSGDFNGDDVISGSAKDTLYITGNTENAYHVLFASTDMSGAKLRVTLDGFTITGGYANGSGYLSTPYLVAPRTGAGAYISYSTIDTISNCIFVGNAAGQANSIYTATSPQSGVGGAIEGTGSIFTITNSVFSKNIASGDGGAFYLSTHSALRLINSTFSDNVSIQEGGGLRSYADSLFVFDSHFINNVGKSGGGIIYSSATTVKIQKNTFMGNRAKNFGGGINTGGTFLDSITNNIFEGNYAQNGGGIAALSGTSTRVIQNCIFNRNAAENGAGLWNNAASPLIVNCLFAKNKATFVGGAIDNQATTTCSPTIINTTIYGNISSAYGSAINRASNTTIKNCIIWGNTATTSTPQPCINYPNIITHTLLEWSSLYPGIGNLNTFPVFIDTTNAIGSDNIWATADDGLRIQSASPARDAGDLTGAPLADISGMLRTGNPDMGAYEYLDGVAISPTEEVGTTYPNPVFDKVFIKISHYNVPTQLYNGQGTLVLSFEECPKELSMRSLANGFYILRVGNKTLKMLKIGK